MAAGDFQFNFTNLNPLNTSGWSTSSLATKLKAAQDATAAKAAADAAQASVYGHVNAGKSGGGGGSGFDPVTGIAGLALGGPLGGLLGGAGGSLFGGSDPRTPAEKLAHQTKMLAKQETKTTQTAGDLAGAQHNIDALNEAISKATDPNVIDHLNKELEKEQKNLGKVQQKHDANTSHADEIKNKITGLNQTLGNTTSNTTPTQANYFNDLVDKALGSRTQASGWHAAAFGTPLVNPDATPAATTPAATTTTNPSVVPNTNLPASTAMPTDHVNKFLKQQKKAALSGWGSAPTLY